MIKTLSVSTLSCIKITHVFIVPNGESAAHITIIFISGDNILNHESKLTVLEKFIWSVNWDGVSKKNHSNLTF